MHSANISLYLVQFGYQTLFEKYWKQKQVWEHMISDEYKAN